MPTHLTYAGAAPHRTALQVDGLCEANGQQCFKGGSSALSHGAQSRLQRLMRCDN